MRSVWWGGWIFAAILVTVAWFISHSAIICLLLLACLLLAHLGYGIMVINDNIGAVGELIAANQKDTYEIKKLLESRKS